jgi:hypothetical protein
MVFTDLSEFLVDSRSTKRAGTIINHSPSGKSKEKLHNWMSTETLMGK